MLTINNNPNSVFFQPEPGKPNPNEPRIPGQLRSRVVRKGQKGRTCVYYALQILLDEAANPKNERSPGEQLLSNHRKEITVWSHKWVPTREYIGEIKKRNLIECTRATVPFLIQCLLQRKAKNLNEPHIDIIIEQLTKFSTQQVYDDLWAYINLEEHEELIRIHTRLLDGINYPENQIEEYFKSRVLNPEIYDFLRNTNAYLPQFPEDQRQEILVSATRRRAVIFQSLYVRIAKEVYGLEISSWTPHQPIDALIKELQLRGPLFVLANLGKGVYIDDPIPLRDKIEGRTIFGWKPNAVRKEEGHAIVIIGAEAINNKGYIYFLDPSSVSIDRNSQEIFKASYERLLSSVLDLHHKRNELIQEESKQDNANLAPSSNEYALYRPKNNTPIE